MKKMTNLSLVLIATLHASLSFAGPMSSQDTLAIGGAGFNSESGTYLNVNAGKISYVDFLADDTVRFSLNTNQAYGITFKNHADASLFKNGIEAMPGRYQVVIPSNYANAANVAISMGGFGGDYVFHLGKGIAPFWDAQVQDTATGKMMSVGDFINKARSFQARRSELTTGNYGLDFVNYWSDMLNHQGNFADSRVSNSQVTAHKSVDRAIGSAAGAPAAVSAGVASF